MGRGDNNRGNSTGYIDQGVEVSGEINFTGSLHVDGRVTGKITSLAGILTIGDPGSIDAQVDVGVCVIQGSLKGDLTARTRVEIRRTGRVNGEMFTPSLLVEEGATFNGIVKMHQAGDEEAIRIVPDQQPEAAERRKVKGA